MFPTPFSKRNKPQPDSLSYEIKKLVRSRITANFHHLSDGGLIGLQKMYIDAARRATLEYGGLYEDTSSYVVVAGPKDPALVATEHFMNCPHDRAIDFLEWCFQSGGCRLQQTA